MKKLFSLLAILMVAMNAWAQAYLLDGDGTSANPYKISQAGELMLFIDKVNNNGQTDVYCELTQDIDMTDYCSRFAPIGTWDKPYTGTFNGNGHRIKNLNYTGAAGKEVGLFGIVAGESTTIKNLIIDSSCSFTTNTTQQAYGAAGIVACLKLVGEKINFTLSGCGNEADINGDLMVAGLVGGLLEAESSNDYKCSITIENCYNTGAIKGRVGETQTAAFIAYGLHKLTVRNCYNIGAVINCTENHSLIRYKELATLDISNVYKLSTVANDANATNTTAKALAEGSVCYLLNGSTSTGTLAWHQTLGTDTRPVLDNTHGTVYKTAEGQCFGNSADVHHTEGAVNADGEFRCSVCKHILRYQEPSQDASGNYLIANRGNLICFANKVNSGQNNINGKLTADIDLGDNQTMIGTSTCKYGGISDGGIFDGDGHTITVNYNSTEDIAALFRYVRGYENKIKNLKTSGTITTSGRQAAGVVGYADGITLENVVSNVTINSTHEGDATHGGLIAEIKKDAYKTTITNCAFTGRFLDKCDYCGGLVGWVGEGSLVTISNCYVDIKEQPNNTNHCQTIVRKSNSADVHINNSYYVTAFGEAQGTQVSAEQVRLGDVCYKLNGSTNTGTLAWTQNLEKDAYPTFGTVGVHYARTMSNEWGTVVLPYAIDYSQSNGNYKLYKLSAASASTLTFTEYPNGTIAAGTPMAVQKLTGDGIDIKPASTPNYNSTTITPVSDVTGWTMKGTYTNLTNQTGIYFIASNQFWWAESPITIAPYRAWFTGPTPSSSVKAFNIVIEDDDVTGIHEIVNGKLSNGKYLENGNVVIVRNGKKYNLNGQALR